MSLAPGCQHERFPRSPLLEEIDEKLEVDAESICARARVNHVAEVQLRPTRGASPLRGERLLETALAITMSAARYHRRIGLETHGALRIGLSFVELRNSEGRQAHAERHEMLQHGRPLGRSSPQGGSGPAVGAST